MPREHGVYAEVTLPTLTGLALGRMGVTPLLMCVAIVAAFLAHEPIVVLLGGRGRRVQADFREPARNRAAVLLAIAVLAGAIALWRASPSARLASLVPLALAAALIPLIFARRDKTRPGELLVALALSSAMIPVAVAGEAPVDIAVGAAAVWAVIFFLGTLTVHAVIIGRGAKAKRKVQSRWPALAAPLIAALAIGSALILAFTGAVPTLAALAVLPTAMVGLTFSALRVHPRHLRRLGWSLVASNVMAFVLLIAGLR